MLAFKKNSTHLHSDQPKMSPVSESSTHALQNYVCFFPLSFLQARELCQGIMPTNLLPIIALRMEPSYTHPPCIKLGGAYKPVSTVPLPDNCVVIPIFQDGSLPFHHNHKYSSPLSQSLHTNSQPSHSMS